MTNAATLHPPPMAIGIPKANTAQTSFVNPAHSLGLPFGAGCWRADLSAARTPM